MLDLVECKYCNDVPVIKGYDGIYVPAICNGEIDYVAGPFEKKPHYNGSWEIGPCNYVYIPICCDGIEFDIRLSLSVYSGFRGVDNFKVEIVDNDVLRDNNSAKCTDICVSELHTLHIGMVYGKVYECVDGGWGNQLWKIIAGPSINNKFISIRIADGGDGYDDNCWYYESSAEEFDYFLPLIEKMEEKRVAVYLSKE